MKNDDLKSISESLSFNSTLIELKLGGNDFDDKGVVCLAHTLARNRSLRSLSLQYTRFETNGFDALADALRVNRTLKKLDVGMCHLPHVDDTTFDFLFDNGVLQLLYVSDTPKYVEQLLDRNRSVDFETVVAPLLFGFCLALAPLQVPPYVQVEIFDRWFDKGPSYIIPLHLKMKLIIGVFESVRKINKK